MGTHSRGHREILWTDPLNVPKVKDFNIVELFSILSNQLRWNILQLIRREERISSKEIVTAMDIPQPLAHFHTKALFDAYLISKEIGYRNQNFWFLNKQTWKSISEIFSDEKTDEKTDDLSYKKEKVERIVNSSITGDKT